MAPLIFLTNDDGIGSPGLHAAVEAVAPLGDLLVVAPKTQQTGAGRSLPPSAGGIEPVEMAVASAGEVRAYSLDGSPAQAVRGGLMLLAERPPDLLISGINYGENLGVGVTISGTVGAAIEGAAFGVPGLAISLETEIEHHLSHSTAVDFEVAAHFTYLFARMMLELALPPRTDVLKVDVPRYATRETPWRITRVSRQNYFHSTVEEEAGVRRFRGYARQINYDTLGADTDIYAIVVDEVVSISPLTIDLTANSDLGALADEVEQVLGESAAHSWPPGPLPDAPPDG